MDAELRELQRQFELAQHAKASVRLSERNIVELIIKLQELCLLDADLLHTVSGKEYLTQERLRDEMEREIEHLGRISLVDLSSSIGVDLYHCERQAQHIILSNANLMVVQGEIISMSYWDAVAEEVNESLKEHGQISLAELARRFNVGAELLTGILSSRLGKIVHGKLEGGQLYTPAYVARIKASLSGAIRAVTIPTSIHAIWSTLQSQLADDEAFVTGGFNEGSILRTVLNDLIKEGVIKGTLRGGGTTWTPLVFAHSQQASVEGFFSQNRYISYDTLKKLAVPQPKYYLEAKYKDGLALETVFAHSSFIGLVDSAADEAISGDSWFDAVDVVPSSFGIFDVKMLLSLCPSVQRALKASTGVILAETCVVSNAFLKAVTEKFEEEPRSLQGPCKRDELSDRFEKIKDVESANENIISGADAGDDKEIVSIQETMQKKDSKRQRAPSMVPRHVAEDTIENTVSGKVGKGRRRSGKLKGNKITNEDNQITSHKSKGKAVDEGDAEILSEVQMAQKLLEWFPEMENAGIDMETAGALSNAVAGHVRPSVILFWSQRKLASAKKKADVIHQHLDILGKRLDEAYANFQLYSKVLTMFEDDKASEALLQCHLLRTTGTEIVDIFLRAQTLEQRIEDGWETNKVDQLLSARPMSNPERVNLAQKLPKPLSLKAKEMVDRLEGKNVAAFEEALQDVVFESGLRMKKLDKKTERALLQTCLKELALQVELEEDPVALFPKVIALLFAQIYGKPLQAPGRALSVIAKRLKEHLPHAAYNDLMEYHTITVSLLATLSISSKETNNLNNDIEEKKEFLKKQAPYLKSIVKSVAVKDKTLNT